MTKIVDRWTLLPHGPLEQVNDGLLTVMAQLMNWGTSKPTVPLAAAHFYVKDKPAFAAQLRGWAALANLKRIIVSHGDLIADDPAGTLLRLAKGIA